MNHTFMKHSGKKLTSALCHLFSCHVALKWLSGLLCKSYEKCNTRVKHQTNSSLTAALSSPSPGPQPPAMTALSYPKRSLLSHVILRNKTLSIFRRRPPNLLPFPTHLAAYVFLQRACFELGDTKTLCAESECKGTWTLLQYSTVLSETIAEMILGKIKNVKPVVSGVMSSTWCNRCNKVHSD